MRAHGEENVQRWRLKTLQNEEGRLLIRDIDTMLEDKRRKAFEHLRRIENCTTHFLRDADGERARKSFEKLRVIDTKLKEEEEAEHEATTSINGDEELEED